MKANQVTGTSRPIPTLIIQNNSTNRKVIKNYSIERYLHGFQNKEA